MEWSWDRQNGLGTDGMVSGEVCFSAKIGMVWGQMGWSWDR